MVYAIILLALLITILASVRLRNIPLRRIPAFNAMQLLVSQAVESGRGVHISFGSNALRDATSISALASAEIAYQLALRAAQSDKPAFITTSDPVTLVLAQDRLQRAYKLRGLLHKYHSTLARWYPQGPLSLVFAAGAGTAMLDEDASTNILIGRFGPELMLIAENAIRYDRNVIAQSDDVHGQAVAYVVSEAPLIGEELYAGAAYIDRTPINVGGIIAQDVIRFILVAVIVGLAVLSFLGVGI